MYSYIITDFSANESNWETYHDKFVDTGKVKYIGSQLERCPQTNSLHFQCFVKFFSKQRGSFIKKLFPRCHWEPVTVERAEAINYGLKDDTRVLGPKEFGTRPKAVDRTMKGGQRTKEQWEEIKKIVITGESSQLPADVVIKYNLERRYTNLKKFFTPKEISLELPRWLPNPWGKILRTSGAGKKRHFWIYSRRPNVGKTYLFAKPLALSYPVHIKSGDFSYWTLDESIKCVVLDEYNSPQLKWSILNQLCDGTFEFRIFQGGLIKLCDPLIIVLSNQTISDLYPNMNVYLYERFNEINVD